MEDLTISEIEIVRKFYKLHMDDVPEDKQGITEFLDSLEISTHFKSNHYDNDMVDQEVNELVDKYFTSPFFSCSESSFDIADNDIEDRKNRMILWIISARDTQPGTVYRHYVGADSSSDELCRFYYYVFDNYYRSIGTTWRNG